MWRSCLERRNAIVHLFAVAIRTHLGTCVKHYVRAYSNSYLLFYPLPFLTPFIFTCCFAQSREIGGEVPGG